MKVVYSHHAKQAMAKREVAAQEVLAVLQDPDVTWETLTEAGQPARVSRRGPLAVVTTTLSSGERLVITVLLNTQEQWTDADARSR